MVRQTLNQRMKKTYLTTSKIPHTILKKNALDIANKAANARHKVMKIYIPKNKDEKVRSRLPSIINNYRKRFENVLRLPNPINEDSDLYLVRFECNKLGNEEYCKQV
jgi:hypothetical protein